MKKIYLSFIAAFCLITGSFSQTVVVAGADAVTLAGNPYTTLKAAFDKINLASQAGNVIVITVTGVTTEAAPAVCRPPVRRENRRCVGLPTRQADFLAQSTHHLGKECHRNRREEIAVAIRNRDHVRADVVQ